MDTRSGESGGTAGNSRRDSRCAGCESAGLASWPRSPRGAGSGSATLHARALQQGVFKESNYVHTRDALPGQTLQMLQTSEDNSRHLCGATSRREHRLAVPPLYPAADGRRKPPSGTGSARYGEGFFGERFTPGIAPPPRASTAAGPMSSRSRSAASCSLRRRSSASCASSVSTSRHRRVHSPPGSPKQSRPSNVRTPRYLQNRARARAPEEDGRDLEHGRHASDTAASLRPAPGPRRGAPRASATRRRAARAAPAAGPARAAAAQAGPTPQNPHRSLPLEVRDERP